MRILIATGGTGGHIYPAIALAEALMLDDSHNEILFIGSDNRMEAQEIPQLGYAFEGIKVSGMNGSILAKMKAASSLFFAYGQCKKIIKRFKPDVTIGFGNYISVPAILAAHRAHCVTMLHEQNSFAGKANRFLARYADAVVGCYEENSQQFPVEKIRILGNPRAQSAAHLIKNTNSLNQFGLNPALPIILIVMGSLGSSSVNKAMVEVLKECANKPYQFLYVTGKRGYEAFIKEAPSLTNLKVVPYIDGLNVMACVDLAIIRGGATTAAEVTALGVATLIIPSPYVPNNHQVLNAKALSNQGAALMIEEKDLTSNQIIAKIESVVLNPIVKEQLQTKAKQLGKIHASDDIIAWIHTLKR